MAKCASKMGGTRRAYFQLKITDEKALFKKDSVHATMEGCLRKRVAFISIKFKAFVIMTRRSKLFVFMVRYGLQFNCSRGIVLIKKPISV